MTLEQLSEMFANVRTKTDWNVDGDMLWGYFFTDPSPEKLECASEELQQHGYHLVDIYQADDESTFWLHVERIETNSPQTLHVRNTELGVFAEKWGLESYDGMDIGPIQN
jgi:hypothetical protein